MCTASHITCSSEPSILSISPSLHNLPNGSNGDSRSLIQTSGRIVNGRPTKPLSDNHAMGGRMRATLSVYGCWFVWLVDAYRQGCVGMSQWWVKFGFSATKFDVTCCKYRAGYFRVDLELVVRFVLIPTRDLCLNMGPTILWISPALPLHLIFSVDMTADNPNHAPSRVWKY